jgi:geranylgeranyl diphosphate synthase type II
MQSFQELLTRFEAFLGETGYPDLPANLYDPCRYMMQLGGKRIRPVLCLMGNELFGDVHPDAYHAATAVELFHNFTLLHDDIMDNAPLRRGKETVYKKYGMSAGILSGDVMNIYAYDHLAKVSPALLPELLKLFNRTAIEVCEGQQLDMDFETRNNVTIDEYLHMITLKTSVLLAASLEMGALIGGASAGNAKLLYEFGKNMGIAFQLQDDYLDAFGDPEKVGKQPGGDIRANKKTFLLLKAYELANPEQRHVLEQLMPTESEKKVDLVMVMYRALGVDKHAEQIKNHYAQLAFDSLEKTAVLQKRKDALHQLASQLLQRDH